MDPSGAPQPPVNTVYKTEGNAATSNPVEERASHQASQGRNVAHRIPDTQSTGFQDATASSLGRGTRGELAGEEQLGRTAETAGRHNELDGQQMRAPGEGEVASAVEQKPGASGEQPDLASDLDRKKQEQAEAREATQEDRRHGNISDGGAGGGVIT
ncbi:hypothetical protein F4808DRAFT_218870 [Astrocystis sublimbata]|nr:hypothetical protein F4808DRAFT_218870 [Astrocystis sublimbata]